ncbi:GNAT family N-acetyltransferase [Agrobacterium vitis]|uniref:GNAT family N-acetyltransferase n=1 Tax=Rhizobium/Agrobacterium group TaxID=227290 RepID=UPI0008DC0A18|nr:MULTISPECIES: GNAT family N-acetyltransferase [Rhizobium/Agrobacterium group]MCF1436009.1 GNAT family N-acetyltransferase [Allorhizobium ampelinum]MCF1473980.1 GNAT family N-acetyltransferase [Allorhizobium ampelinum]MUO89210.1 GNAT family N-acetyltransferase [Agrobacterium vitis]MUZ52681.1 GNAT family N-acetyltransferase [Agrobacterium vitis]MUZ92132.1 GNAT family N-acetyltransferase [Agrobacterium vitis]
MSSDLLVRPLTNDDEADWRRLWRAYLAFYETELPEEIYATTFARLTGQGAGEFRGFLAVAGGKAVGLSHYVFHRSCWYIADVCYLQDLYVDPEVRGLGIGRALIAAVNAAAAEAGAGKVYWMTQEFNSTARRLYDQVADKTPFIIYQQPL